LDRIIQLNLPKIHYHFKKHGLKVEMFATEWFITLFSVILPPEMAASVLDNFMLEGWSAMYRISVALLRLHETELLKTSSIYELTDKLLSISNSDDRL
jgi:hypothetical protein